MPAQGRQLDDWIQAYMQFSASSEAPDKFHFWTAASVIAGALRRRVWINMGYFEWTPNMYIIFVAPPGIVSKSTTANIGMNLLREIPGIKFGPDAITWQALTQALAQSTEMVAMPDGTFHSMSALTIVSGELGTFFNPHDREMVDLLVALWDGQRGVFTKTTKTQGNDVIENPWINVLGCTTPAWIAGNFPEYLIGGGFTSRCIFVYCDYKRHLSAYPFRTLPANFGQQRQTLINDLKVISDLCGEVTLTQGAIDYGEKWYSDHYSKQPPWLNNNRFQGYLARKQTHIHKLAMVLSAAKRNDLKITEIELDAASQIMTTIEADMPKVFANIGRSNASLAIMDIVQIVKAYSSVPYKDLMRQSLRTLSKKDFDEALTAAISAGFLEIKKNKQNENEISYKGEGL